MSTPPFILHILVANGDPDGLRVVERSNWNGKAVVFPRALYPTVRKREEFQQPGVYLLIGPREDGDGEKIYVGEGDPVYHRMEAHYATKDFWTRAVFFVAGPGQLNKAHVQYLEAQLIQRARSAKRMPLDNGNTPTEPTLSEMDRAYLEVFLQNLLGMLPVLGLTAFEQSAPATSAETIFPVLYCEGKGIKATGHDAPQGFIVHRGSVAAREHTPSLTKNFPRASTILEDLVKSGVLEVYNDNFRFSQDYPFSSPSLASTIVLGRVSNGRTDWKDGEGRTLKSLQEAQAG